MIQIRNLCKTFKLNRRRRKELGADQERASSRSLDALADVSFECRSGRVFGLIGPNGAGKTTALRIIATLLRPTAGSVTVTGVDAIREPQRARERIGFLTGNTGLYDRLTATEMVRYHAQLHGMPEARFEQSRQRLFSLLDMEGFANRRIGRLSSGMRQKISIVRTIIHDPEVMVFDEPTAGLDVMSSRRIVELIRLCRDEGKTVLLSTHIMAEVQQLCDDIAIIHKGKLHFCGSKEQFEAQMTASSYDDEFIRLVGEA